MLCEISGASKMSSLTLCGYMSEQIMEVTTMQGGKDILMEGILEIVPEQNLGIHFFKTWELVSVLGNTAS